MGPYRDLSLSNLEGWSRMTKTKPKDKVWWCYHCDKWFKEPVKVKAHEECSKTDIAKVGKETWK